MKLQRKTKTRRLNENGVAASKRAAIFTNVLNVFTLDWIFVKVSNLVQCLRLEYIKYILTFFIEVTNSLKVFYLTPHTELT